MRRDHPSHPETHYCLCLCSYHWYYRTTKKLKNGTPGNYCLCVCNKETCCPFCLAVENTTDGCAVAVSDSLRLEGRSKKIWCQPHISCPDADISSYLKTVLSIIYQFNSYSGMYIWLLKIQIPWMNTIHYMHMFVDKYRAMKFPEINSGNKCFENNLWYEHFTTFLILCFVIMCHQFLSG